MAEETEVVEETKAAKGRKARGASEAAEVAGAREDGSVVLLSGSLYVPS
jgi:hypothetical protein